MALILGIFLANYVGAFVVGGILSSFGASSFQFEVSPFIAYVISPLLLIIAVFIATLLGASDVNKIKIYENIKE
jgi:putative ABC transport system permease protein